MRSVSMTIISQCSPSKFTTENQTTFCIWNRTDGALQLLFDGISQETLKNVILQHILGKASPLMPSKVHPRDGNNI